MFIFNKFTDYANDAINEAITIASRLGHTFVGSEHLLYGLSTRENSVSKSILSKKNIKKTDIYNKLIKYNGQGETINLTPENFTPRLKKIMENSIVKAQKLNHKLAGTEHLLLSILEQNDGYALIIIQELGVDIEIMFSDIITDLVKVSSISKENNNNYTNVNTSINELLKYGKDLNLLASKKKLDPVLKRDLEISRVIKTLSRRTKNNPCLVGESGVGKTAIVEGLAQLIESGEVDDNLKDKKIISIDISTILAGAKYRGDFEERIQKIIEQAKQNKDIILFIDEIHNIIGTGSSEGAMDAANILKPSLSRGEIQIIGATTIDEYEKKILKDVALDRRFQKIDILPPNKNVTKEILQGIKYKYEDYHKVNISDEVIDYVIYCADRYLKDRFFPDKAIDLIDEAGATMKIKNYSFNREDKNIYFKNQKEKSFLKRDFLKAQSYNKLQKLTQFRTDKENNFQYSDITKDDIAKVISEWTGIPTQKITQDDSKKLLELENNLKRNIIGQDKSISAIALAVKRGRLGLSGNDKPIGSFLFLGSTGVGKTKLCKELTKQLFDSENDMIRLDMSEYMEKHSVSKLIGAPPGYVGFEDGGYLTKMVRRKPYSLILFDEIEKAHKDVLSILLQILDDGRLTDSFGKVTDFRQCIIILTSNIGAKKAQDTRKLGFYNDNENNENEKAKQQIILNELRQFFKPELINRLDEIIIFNSLTMDNIVKIGEIFIDEIKEKMLQKDIILDVDKNLIYDLALKCNYQKFGARDLKRMIISEVENKIVDILLDDNENVINKINISKTGIEIIRKTEDIYLLN